MGAKLSKKKKGYCLGAGKDGESTDTTEVEQKETENQEGQKDDAAEPKGEKASTDQSQSNGINEETKDNKSDVEATTGETTKEESNKDQKPEIKISTAEKVEEKDQPQGKSSALDQACEKEKVNSSEDKTKTECEVKETPAVAVDKPTQESKPVKEKEGSECQSHSCDTKQFAPVQNEVEVKPLSEPVIKAEIEQTEKAPMETGHASEKAAEVPTQANEPIAEPEKVPEKVEPSAPKSVTVESNPVIKIEVVEPEVESSVQITEEVKSEAAPVPEKVDSALPNSDPTSEPSLPEPVAATKESEPAPEPEPSHVPAPEPSQVLAPEPEPSSPPEPVKSALPEAVPEIKIEAAVPEQPIAPPEQAVKSEKESEPVPCPASDKTSEQKGQELIPEPLPPKSTEVPDETTDAQEPTENQESLGCHEGTNAVTIQVPTTEAASIEQPTEISEQHDAPVIPNGPSENSAEDYHAEAYPISTDLKVEDKEQKVEEHGDLDKPAKQQESQVVKEDCETAINVSVTSKNENDTKETHDASQHCNSEEKKENHDTSAEKVKNEKESPAPEILEKHGVGNGLPIKEEIKVHLENDCDKDLHDIKGQSESHEIQVCNE